MQKAHRHFNSLVALAPVFFAVFTLTAAAQTNPVPLINDPLVPASAVPGGKSFTLIVNGTGFASGASVLWNGSALLTVVNSQGKLTATVPAADIATAGTAYVSVTNPKASQSSNVVLFPITQPGPSVTFATSTAATLVIPVVLGVGDFNGDGNPDIALGDDYGNINVLLGRGDGTFSGPVVTPGAAYGQTAAIGDFNGDGKLDIITDYADVFFGNGDGTFTAGPYYNQIFGFGISVGDFNGDGQPDLAIAFCLSPTIGIMLGDGNGTFAPVSTSLNAGSCEAPAVGDFNRDGKLDLASTDPDTGLVAVFLGNGDGTFQNPVDYGSQSDTKGVTTGDFNGDGILDLAATNYSGDGVFVMFGRGDGTFGTATSYPATGPFLINSGDFNGDGILDLITANCCNDSVSLFLGNPDGSFQTRVDYSVPSTELFYATGDFNRDGKLDFVAANTAVYLFLQSTAVLSTTSLTYSGQSVGTTSPPQAVTLMNTGATALTISGITVTGTNSTDFAQTNNCGTSLAAGASCAINVTFTPTATGARSATLNISDSAAGSPQTVSLTGTGTQPTVVLSPTSLTFGVILVKSSTQPKPVTLTNTGNGSLSITGISTTGDFSQTNTCGSSVAAGASCVINVTFKPTATGTRTGSLSITDNAPGSPQTVTLTGTGTVVRLSAVSINFGSQPVGTTSQPVRLSLANAGTAAIAISSIGIQGADAGDFAETNTCGKSLPAGATCAIKVTFTPKAKGTRTATLGVTDNGGGSPQRVALSGDGT